MRSSPVPAAVGTVGLVVRLASNARGAVESGNLSKPGPFLELSRRRNLLRRLRRRSRKRSGRLVPCSGRSINWRPPRAIPPLVFA
jgi:hypothetical protein